MAPKGSVATRLRTTDLMYANFVVLMSVTNVTKLLWGRTRILEGIKKFDFKICSHSVCPGALYCCFFLPGRNIATETYCSVEKTVLWLKQEKIRLNGLLSLLQLPLGIWLASSIQITGKRDKLEMTQTLLKDKNMSKDEW